jgi:hypothetical protein
MSRVPWLCRHGFHRWTYWDNGAFITHFHRVCKRCGRKEESFIHPDRWRKEQSIEEMLAAIAARDPEGGRIMREAFAPIQDLCDDLLVQGLVQDDTGGCR